MPFGALKRKTARRDIRARAVCGVELCNRSLAQRMGEAIRWRKTWRRLFHNKRRASRLGSIQ